MILIYLLLFVPQLLLSQEDNQNIAFEYFRNKEYDKAAEFFLKLYNSKNSIFYYNYYISCLVQQQQYEDAINSVNNEFKKSRKNYQYKIILAYIYKAWNKLEEYNKIVSEILKNIPENTTSIINLTNQCISFQDYYLAEQIFIEARKMKNIDYKFYIELANVYRAQGYFDKMIDEYLKMLDDDPSSIQTVQNQLQNTIYSSKNKELLDLLIKKIILKINQSRENKILEELLLWLYIQKKDYVKAYNFALTLVKKNNEDGGRIFQLGSIAYNNENYEIAQKCFKFFVDKGELNHWYFEAFSNYILSIYYQKNKNKFSEQEANELDQMFSKYISQFGINKNTFSVIIAYANFIVIQFHNYDSAIDIISQLLTDRNLTIEQQLIAKVYMADIYLYKEDLSEAVILYTQVEKSRNDLPIVHEAKYKKALVAYYSGDFEWANAQLEVIKGSTSKLPSNDAMQLSFLISKLSEIDTTYELLKYLSRVDFSIFQHKINEAKNNVILLKQNKMSQEINDIILYKEADIDQLENNFELAVNKYDTLINKFPGSIITPKAIYQSGLIYETVLKDNNKAMEYYEKLFIQFPYSYYSEEARKRYRILRGDTIDAVENDNIFQ